MRGGDRPPLARLVVRARPMSAGLFVLCGASGTGKTSLARLMQADGAVAAAVSHTTRAPRAGETEGRDYFFVDDAAFDRMLVAGDFVESATVHGGRYGTSRAEIEKLENDGRDILLEIDWQGAMEIKRKMPRATLVFLLPPSFADLKARLVARGKDGADVIEARLRAARAEIARARAFDYAIINSDLNRARDDLRAVIRARKLRIAPDAPLPIED